MREVFLRAIPAGVLAAAIFWMLAGQRCSGAGIIVPFTARIAAGDSTRIIIAGSAKFWVQHWRGGHAAGGAVFVFLLPVPAGNIVAGTLVFALLAWVRVKKEVEACTNHLGTDRARGR